MSETVIDRAAVMAELLYQGRSYRARQRASGASEAFIQQRLHNVLAKVANRFGLDTAEAGWLADEAIERLAEG